jgi:hypothetical protein
MAEAAKKLSRSANEALDRTASKPGLERNLELTHNARTTEIAAVLAFIS